MTDLKQIVELWKPGPRYGIGIAEETGELLIEDHAKHVLVARSGRIAEPLLMELLMQANAAPALAADRKRAGEILLPQLLGEIGAEEAYPMSMPITLVLTLEQARELAALLGDIE